MFSVSIRHHVEDCLIWVGLFVVSILNVIVINDQVKEDFWSIFGAWESLGDKVRNENEKAQWRLGLTHPKCPLQWLFLSSHTIPQSSLLISRVSGPHFLPHPIVSRPFEPGSFLYRPGISATTSNLLQFSNLISWTMDLGYHPKDAEVVSLEWGGLY